MTRTASIIPAATSRNEVRLQLFGALNASRIATLRDSLEALAASPARQVVLDLSAVSSMDGSGIGAIAFLFKRLVARGRKLVLTGVSGEPLALLSQLGLTRVLGVIEAAPAAAAWSDDLLLAAGD